MTDTPKLSELIELLVDLRELVLVAGSPNANTIIASNIIEGWYTLIRDDPALFAEIAAAHALARSVTDARQGPDYVIGGLADPGSGIRARHSMYDRRPDAFEVET